MNEAGRPNVESREYSSAGAVPSRTALDRQMASTLRSYMSEEDLRTLRVDLDGEPDKARALLNLIAKVREVTTYLSTGVTLSFIDEIKYAGH